MTNDNPETKEERLERLRQAELFHNATAAELKADDDCLNDMTLPKPTPRFDLHMTNNNPPKPPTDPEEDWWAKLAATKPTAKSESDAATKPAFDLPFIEGLGESWTIYGNGEVTNGVSAAERDAADRQREEEALQEPAAAQEPATKAEGK